jgi:hypothetical protein
VKRTQIVLGVAAFTLGILSVGPRVCATEPEDRAANSNVGGEPFDGARLTLPFQTRENLSLGAVTESSAELLRPISWPNSLPTRSLR